MTSRTCIFINPIERRQKLFMSELRRRGWRVTEIYIKERGIKFHSLSLLKNYPIQLKRLLKIINREKPAFIFFTHYYFPLQVPFLFITKLLRKKTAVDYYHTLSEESRFKNPILSRLFHILFWKYLNFTDMFVTFKGQEPFLKAHHIDRNKVFYLENCPDLELLSLTKRRDKPLDFPKGRFILSYHGGVAHHKIQLFFPIYKELLRENNLHMFLIGMQTFLEQNREYAREVKGYIDELELGKYVTLTQVLPYEDVMSMLYYSDIYIALLNDETWRGLTEMRTGLLEAMSLAKPCVHARTDAITDYGVFEDGENIILINPHDVKGSAEKLSHYLNNRQELNRIGRNARDTIEQHFNLEKQMDGFLEKVSYSRNKR